MSNTRLLKVSHPDRPEFYVPQQNVGNRWQEFYHSGPDGVQPALFEKPEQAAAFLQNPSMWVPGHNPATGWTVEVVPLPQP